MNVIASPSLCAFLFVIAGLIQCAAVASASAPDCDGPLETITLQAASEVSGGTTHISLVLTNNSARSIRLLALGVGRTYAWEIVPTAIPFNLSPPPGWNANLSLEYEGSHLSLVWNALEPSAYLTIGSALRGFAFSLPGEQDPSASLPFRVLFSDGSCGWSSWKLTSQRDR